MNTILCNLYYYPIKIYVALCCYFYFKRLTVQGLENIPSKGPLIYAINHQNSLLDAFVCHAASRRNPYFLTRADAFKNKSIDKFLRGIKMLPIYRTRDGPESIAKNEQIFEATKDILTDGGVVAIFPEGSHCLTHRIRPLKKGIARMAFMTEAAADFNLNLQIIPIGISYESYFSTKGRALVSYGKPIRVADYKQTFLKNETEAYNKLLSELSSKMKSLIVNIESEDYEEVLNTFKRKRVYKSSLKDQLKSDQALVKAIEKGEDFEGVSDRDNPLIRAICSAWSTVRWAAGFIPKTIVELLVAKTVRDRHFIGTMKFSYSMLIYPLFFSLLYFLYRHF